MNLQTVYQKHTQSTLASLYSDISNFPCDLTCFLHSSEQKSRQQFSMLCLRRLWHSRLQSICGKTSNT